MAVIGSLLATRYQGRMTAAVAPYRIPHAIHSTILGSIGGALGVRPGEAELRRQRIWARASASGASQRH